jgi:Putative beta barrel porin-7 (BBP7)
MRKQLFGSVAAVLAGAGAVFGQQTTPAPDPLSPYLVVAGPIVTASVVGPSAAPVLLPVPGKPTAGTTTETGNGIVADGGSTGVRPGVDFLPNPCDVCPRSPKWYGDLAYLLAWIKNGNNSTPLVTAGTPTNFGVIGSPGPVAVLFGGRDIEFDGFTGVRGTVGRWFDDKATFGFEAGGFLLERRSELFSVFGNGDPTGTVVIARPLIDTTLPPPGEDVFVIAEPGVQTGGVIASASSRLWGAEGNFVCNWSDRCRTRLDLLAGFRYVDLLETLTINESSALLGTQFAANEVDAFDCRSQFYGGQIGTRWVWTRGRLSVTSVSKVALGFTHEVIERLGSTTFFGFGAAPVTVLGGQLVLPSNYGRDTRDRFAVSPASQLLLGYRVTKNATAFIGYEFLYISSVVRPGENVDRVLDPAGLPLPSGPGAVTTRPFRGLIGSDFYVNALSVGMSINF